MDFKKINILEAIGKNVYSDKYGLCSLELKDICLKIGKSKIIGRDNMFVCREDGTYTLFTKNDLPNLFNMKFGYLSGDDYIYTNEVSGDYENLIKINNAKFALDIKICPSYDNSQNVMLNTEKEIDKKEILKNAFYFAESYRSATVIFSQLYNGKNVYIQGRGTFKVNNFTCSPNENDIICDLVNSRGITTKLLANGQTSEGLYVCELPIVYENEFIGFNECLNEIALQPFVKKAQDGLINVFWQPIDDAVRYLVDVYTCIDEANYKRVYHMRTYDIDRNTHFLSLNGLLVNTIIVIKAEDRSGKIIAQSRGIEDRRPKKW